MRTSRGDIFDPANVRLTGGLIGAGVSIAGAASAGGSLAQDFAAKILTTAGLIDISGAAAGQIKFPATQNASSNANTLDDYEEGAWTPTDGSGAGLAISVTAGDCFYTKTGDLVTCFFVATYPATASGAAAALAGLPFTVKSAPGTYSGGGGLTANVAGAPVMLTGGIVTSGFRLYNATTGIALGNANFSGGTVAGVFTYKAA